MEMKIGDHVCALRIPFQIDLPTGGSLQRCAYIYLIDGERVCLIDSGVAGSEGMIFEYVRWTGRNPDDVSLLVLTHSHPDHIGAAEAIKQRTNCVVAAHAAEKQWIEDVELQAKERPVPGFHSLVGGSVEVDRILADGDVLELGRELHLEAIHTPGHSKGSLSLLLREEMTLFAGDSVPCTGDMPIYDDAVESARSIQRLKGIEGIRFLLPSWAEPREGEEAYQLLDEGLDYLWKIHHAVMEVATGDTSMDPMELCEQVVSRLGLPEIAVNPLVAKALQSHLRVDEQQGVFMQ